MAPSFTPRTGPIAQQAAAPLAQPYAHSNDTTHHYSRRRYLTSKMTSTSTGRRAEGSRGRTATARALVFSEDLLQQLRSSVCDLRLIAPISRGSHRDAEPDDPHHFVERSQMLPRNSKHVGRREVSPIFIHRHKRGQEASNVRPTATTMHKNSRLHSYAVSDPNISPASVARCYPASTLA